MKSDQFTNKLISCRNIFKQHMVPGILGTAAFLASGTINANDPGKSPLSANDATGERPNIIFIMADDLGYGDLGCYGQQKIKTPNIDKLAGESMRFTQAYAGSTVSAPSRCSLMTGLHNGHGRVRDNIPHGVFLLPDDFTIAEMLKQAGYKTGGIGKWSLGNPGSWGVPVNQGFDYYYGHLNQDQAHFYYPHYLWENNEVVLLFGNRAEKKQEYTQDLFTEKALTFIKANRSNPFFLYLPYTTPHYSDYPQNTPEHFIVPSDKPYTEKEWPQIAKNYAAMITRLDSDVGKIEALIRDLNLEENTLIIFTSDNGPYQGVSVPIEFFDSNGPCRGGKRDMYEGGLRIPFIAKWKNVIPEGTENNEPIAFWDILPTFAEIVNYPGNLKTDGISFLPLLLGEEKTLPERYFFWDYGHAREIYSQAVRYKNYKGIFQSNKGEKSFELYNLENDPGETNDISSENPELVKKIKAIMKESYIYSEHYDISQHLQ